MSDDEKEIKDPIEPKFPWWVLVVVLALWGINLGWGVWAMDNDRTKGGQWGDIFGAVNALFSALAFLMIYYGIQMQRHEVKLAKRELEESKKQTKAQKFALDKQNEATERQMFENSFFALSQRIEKSRLNMSYEVYDSEQFDTEFETTTSTYQGFEALEKIRFDLDTIFYNNIIPVTIDYPIKQAQIQINSINDDLFGNVFTNGTMSNHFNLIYLLFTLIIKNKSLLNRNNSNQNLEYYVLIAKSQFVKYEEYIFLIFACAAKVKDMYYKQFLQTIRDCGFDFGKQSEYFYYHFAIKAEE